MSPKASSISSDRLPRLGNDIGRRGMANVVSLDLSPAALCNLDGEPVNIERFEKTIEYSRPIEENERKYERTEDPMIQELL